MSIASAILAKQQQIADAYTAISGKGGTLPATQNLTNLATAISNIPSSGSAYNGMLIESNGSSNTGFVLKSIGITNVSAYQYMFNKFYIFDSAISSLDLSSIETISGEQAFAYSFQILTSLLTATIGADTITGSQAFYCAFQGCTGITDIYFPNIKTTSFGTFRNQFQSMMNTTGNAITHTIHFPSNMESTISTLTDYPLFGGTSGYVVLAYDLPATE